MAQEFGERTEAPTAKRRQTAVEQGDVLKSRDFATALVVLAGCAWFAFAGPSLVSACKAVMAASFSFGRGDVEDFSPWRPLAAAGWKLAPSLGMLFAVSVIAGIISQAGLSGIRWNGGLMAPKFNRINPASGLKRIFGPQGWIELGKSLLKVILLGSMGAWMLWKSTKSDLGLSSNNIEHTLGTMGSSLTGLLFAMAAGLVAIAMVDVPVQAIRRYANLRMTKQEIRDEHKESDGSPEVKQAIRSRQREMAKRSARKALETAHVVLTNPTHFSVALRYDRGKDQVPVVVAKGRGVTALAIRELAAEMSVPVLEYPALARAVYYTSRENQEIRDDLYGAVATILAFVFGINASRGGRTPPNIEVPTTARFDENGVKS